MPQIKAADLTAVLKRKLMPCYLISGDEPLLVQEACDEVLAAARAAGFSERSIIYAEGSYRWDDLLHDVASMSLFSSRRVLDVRVSGNKFDREASEVLRQYAQQPPEDVLLLLRSSRLESTQRQSAWYKALEKIGVLVPIYVISPAEMPGWLRSRLRQANLKLDTDALQHFTERVEGNLLAATQEIQKLCLLDLPEPISLEALLRVSEDASSYQVFDLIDAMLGGERARVVRGLASLQAEGAAVFPVLGALAGQLRSVQAGNPGYGPRQSLIAQFRRRNAGLDISLVIAELALLDAQAKGQLLGDAWQSLERLLLNLTGTQLPTLEAQQRALQRG